MSRYATPSDIFDIVEVLRTTEPARLVAIQAQLDAASDEADGYLSGRFALPLIAWGKDLTQKVCLLATIACFGPGFNPESAEYKFLKGREEDAREWLRAVRDDKVVPRVTDSSADAKGATRDGGYAIALNRNPDGTFTEGAPQRRW